MNAPFFVPTRTPVVIDLGLGPATHAERNSIIKGIMGSTVERHEGLSVEFKIHGHDRPGRSAGELGALFLVVDFGEDPRVFEDGYVEVRRLFRLVDVPKEGVIRRNRRCLGVVGVLMKDMTSQRGWFRTSENANEDDERGGGAPRGSTDERPRFRSRKWMAPSHSG
jgi:hypothetical protein